MTLDWTAFTPMSAALGGALIGLGSAMLLLLTGRVAGVSGILGGLLGLDRRDMPWRAAFLLGLLVTPLLFAWAHRTPTIVVEAAPMTLIVAGFLVGIGTRYGAGCTSGHGICGLSRLSPRSFVATLCFMAAGFVTVLIVRHVLGGGA
ncbi:MAG TPA: YeeE/YedE thiosulfate transporter family protein [Casimicrobiaceae bacterium]|nr:YeeE/YedE thiosulfate transporter family protein [Casimicrobiaceae bacterium]